VHTPADTALLVIGVASPYAWDVVESAQRAGYAVTCVDNHGGADPRLPGLTALDDRTDRGLAFTVALSSPVHRPTAVRALAAAAFTWPVSLVDRTAVVASTVAVGHCVYVNAGAVVASNTHLGCAVNVNRSASIGHDNRIGWGTSVGPGVTTGGGVGIGAHTLVGVGAVVRPGVTIGAWCTIGAGAVVVDDVTPGSVVVGNPAKAVRTSQVAEVDSCPFC
jgi:sugar O-acyltransferase (sialic acid O-acetyltransferase NeuD family)